MQQTGSSGIWMATNTCDPSVDKQDDISLTGRSCVEECILPGVFGKALQRINPHIDFEHPENNDFHCVNRMWIK